MAAGAPYSRPTAPAAMLMPHAHSPSSRRGRGGQGEGLEASNQDCPEAGRLEAAALELGLELGHLHIVIDP